MVCDGVIYPNIGQGSVNNENVIDIDISAQIELVGMSVRATMIMTVQFNI